MRRVTFAAGALAVIGLVACGTFLAANDAEPTGGDGGAGGASDGGNGAAFDGSDVDATVTVIDPDGGVTPKPCTARFCQSFDDADAGPFFGFKRFGPSASVVVSSGARDDVSLSPPRSFRVVTDQNSTEGWLELDFGDALSGTVHVAMWGDTFDFTQSAKVVAVNCEEGDMARVRVVAQQLGFDSSEDPGTRFGPVPTKKWVSIDLDFVKDALGGGVGARATLHVGAATATVGRTKCSPPIRVRIGPSLSAGSTFDVSFDDVAIDWKP